MESTIQKFTPNMNVEDLEYRGGKAKYEMAQLLRSAIVNQQICWYEDCGMIMHKSKKHNLVHEIAEVALKESNFGYRLHNLPGTHDDRVVALGMALLGLVQLHPKRNLWMGDETIKEGESEAQWLMNSPWF